MIPHLMLAGIQRAESPSAHARSWPAELVAKLPYDDELKEKFLEDKTSLF